MNFSPTAMGPSAGPAERQNSLDALRGLAAISVVFIHSVYGSGVAYVPGWMRQVVLMFDVPVFFFLAGWAQALRPVSSRTLQGLLRLYVDYVIFSVFVMGLCIVIGSNGWIDLVRIFILQGFRTKDVPIFGESMWFVKVYLFVSIALFFVLSGVQSLSANRKKRGTACFAAFLAILPVLFIFSQHIYVMFYALFWMMGWLFAVYGFKRMSPLLVVGSWLVIGASFGLDGIRTNFFSFSKFPPDAFYFFLSLPSIVVCMVAQSARFKNTLLEWMGRNALWIYFAQGLSSSFIRWLVPGDAAARWPAVLLVLFLVNLCLALAIGTLLRRAITPMREVCIARLEPVWRSAKNGFRTAG